MPENDGVIQLTVPRREQIKAYDTVTGEVLILCRKCEQVKRVEVTRNQISTWASGGLIQVVMPHLTAGDRELLVSGVCEPCFDKMWEEK
jgi:hypothetical protein